MEINSQYDFFKNVRLDDDGNLLVALNGSGATEVFMYDTFADFPTTGNGDSLYVATDANVIYRYDTTLNSYVILNDPDVVNPDAPEEGQTFYVRLATSSRLNTCTYNNGTSGSGATLTATVNGQLGEINFAQPRIDGVAAVAGDVILIKNQSSALQNGIYEVTQLGDVSNPFILTRIDGYNETSEVYPSIVFVAAGTNNVNRYFSQSTVNPVIGTNNLVYGVATTSQPASPLLFYDTVTAAALPACTYASGTTYPTIPGWGATLTANANGALGVVNGVTMTSGMQVIVKDQVNQAHNGCYTLTNAGSATQRWVLTRQVSDSSQFYKGREFTVTNPNCNQYGSRWSVSSPLSMSNLNYGVTNIIFSQKNTEGLKNTPNSIYVNGPSIGVVDFTVEVDNDINLSVLNANNPTNYNYLDIMTGSISLEVNDTFANNITITEQTVELSTEDGNQYVSLDGVNKTIRIEAGDGALASGFLDIQAGSTGINLNHDTYVTIGTDNGTNGIEIDGTDMSFYAYANGTLFLNSTHGVRLVSNQIVGNGNKVSISGLPVYADDTAAGVGGLTSTMIYRTVTGELRIKL